MPRRRRVHLRCHAPDGRTFILEQDARRTHAQLRIWLAGEKRYQRTSVPFNLLLPDPDRTTRAAAIRHATERVMTDPALNSASRANTPPTLGEALAVACAPSTTRKREAHSTQHEEWERARREILAVLPADFPLDDLSGEHVVIIAKSATLRRALGADLERWQDIVAFHRSLPSPHEHRAGWIDDAVERAFSTVQAHHFMSQSPAELLRPITLVWSRRVVELFRAMLRHVGARTKRFSALRGFVTPPDFMNDVRAAARRHDIVFEETPFRPRRSDDETRALMRELTDPRYWMRDLLAGIAGTTASRELLASDVRLLDDGAEVYCQRRERYANRRAWHRADDDAAAVLRTLLTGPYGALEAGRVAGGSDYRLVSDVRWDGTTLSLVRRAEDPADPEADALLDPRAWLLLMLGAEGRMGQVRRAMRSNLHVEGHTEELLLDVPDTERKRASLLLLAPAQQAALTFTLRVGYLADLERRFRGGGLTDFPLIPSGRLKRGRARIDAFGFVDDRTLNDWAREVERRLGIPRVEGEGMYGWRRAFVDLYDGWSTNARVKSLITGHTDLREPTYGATRVTVYLDPRDVPLLREGQRLLEHARTLYPRTGLPPQAPETRGPTRGPAGAGEDLGGTG